AEFQQIRAAYEQLDRMLRYGGSFQAMPNVASSDWQHDAGDAVSQNDAAEGHSGTVGGGAAPIAAPPDLHERIASEPAEDLYAELRTKPDKSPFDFYALALLSDVCDRRDGLQFARWLLEGIRKCPDDYALPRLLQAYFRGPLPDGALAKLLVASAKAIGRDAFYPITEPGWDVLLRGESLDTFVATLRKCEPQLQDISIAGKMAFTIRALRVASWKTAGAKPESAAWVSEAMDFVESNFEQIPPELEFEVDLLGLMQEYLSVRDAFVAAGGLRGRLDQALQVYFTSDQVPGDREIVERQLELATDTDGLLYAFPAVDDEEATSHFYSLWQWVSYEVAERCGEEEQQDIDFNLWSGRCHALLVQLETKSDSSSLGRLWNWSGIAYGAVWCVSLLIPSLILSFAATMLGIGIEQASFSFAGPWVFGVLLIAAIGLGVWLGFKLARLIRERIYHPFCRHIALRCYNKLWRRDAMGLLGRSQLPFHVYRELLAGQASNEISTSIWVSNHAGQDYGLALYAIAQRHVV
ncbi:MAG: hypothetical protein AAGF31_07380, partial [Planctomycetota bacterium]